MKSLSWWVRLSKGVICAVICEDEGEFMENMTAYEANERFGIEIPSEGFLAEETNRNRIQVA